MSDKHTPGPWKVAHDRDLDPGYFVTGGDEIGSVVCEIRKYRESPGEWLANARLIAAAPALLEALKWALPYAANGMPTLEVAELKKARAAIKSVTDPA